MKHGMLAASLAAAIFVAGCMGASPVTSLGEDVPSYCIKSRAAYAGHMDFCVVRSCPADDVKLAGVVQSKAKAICAKPSHTAADLTSIKALVAEQRAVGRRK
jgi:hypothetical protein